MFTAAKDVSTALSPTDFHVLLALAAGDRYGYAILKAIEQESLGAVRPQIGSLYRVIARLLSSGLVRETTPKHHDDDHPGRPRRYYGLTAAGRRALQGEADRLHNALALAESRQIQKAGVRS